MESFLEHPQLVKFWFLKYFWKDVELRDFCFVSFMFMFIFFVPHQSAIEEIIPIARSSPSREKLLLKKLEFPFWIDIKYSTSFKNMPRWWPHMKPCCRGRIITILIKYHTFPSQDSCHSAQSLQATIKLSSCVNWVFPSFCFLTKKGETSCLCFYCLWGYASQNLNMLSLTFWATLLALNLWCLQFSCLSFLCLTLCLLNLSGMAFFLYSLLPGSGWDLQHECSR